MCGYLRSRNITQRDMSLNRDQPTYSKFTDHSKRNRQRNWENPYIHLKAQHTYTSDNHN